MRYCLQHGFARLGVLTVIHELFNMNDSLLLRGLGIVQQLLLREHRTVCLRHGQLLVSIYPRRNCNDGSTVAVRVLPSPFNGCEKSLVVGHDYNTRLQVIWRPRESLYRECVLRVDIRRHLSRRKRI